MSDAPEYQGLTPILRPANGARYRRTDWPKYFGYSGTKYFPDGTFTVPNKPPELIRDDARIATIRRTFFIDMRTGRGYMEDEVTDDIESAQRNNEA